MKKKAIPFYICLFLIINSLVLTNNESEVQSNQAIPIDFEPITVSYDIHAPIDISLDSEFVSYGFDGSGTELDPYLIKGLSITSITPSPCIWIRYTTVHFVIRDCYLYTDQQIQTVHIYQVADNTAKIINNSIIATSDQTALLIFYSDGVIVSDNYIHAVETAIGIGTSDNLLIQGNSLSGATGIFADISLFSTIEGNYINEPYIGFHFFNSNYLRLFNNTIQNSEMSGISIQQTDHCFIAGNRIENTTTNVGLRLAYCDDSIICYNWFEGCHSWGVFVAQSASKRNIIHHNVFIDNAFGLATSQAGDNGVQTSWFDMVSLQGNYWSDWGGGVYSIDGTAFNSDPYPLIGYPILAWAGLDIPEFALDDIHEENDYFWEAKSLTVNDIHTLVMLDEDYFKLTLERFYTLSVTIDYSLTELDITVALYDQNQVELLSIHDPGSGYTLEHNCAYTGDYYLVILPDQFNLPVTTYNLDIIAEVGFSIDDNYEENDVFIDAAEYDNPLILIQELIYADKDYFKLTLEKRSVLTVNITFESLLVDLDIYLLPYDYDGNVDDILAQSKSVSQTEEFEYTIGVNNDYIICISSTDTNGLPTIPIDYTLTITILVPTGATSSFTIILTLISLISLAIVRGKFIK